MSKDVAVQQPTVFDDRLGASAAAWSARLRKAGTLAVQNPLGTLGLLIIVVFVASAFLAPWIAPYSPTDIHSGKPTESMSWSHPFGTERIGRDILSRVLYGGRISLSVAFISVIGGATVGMVIGIISGYFGGAIDSVIQRTVDTAIAFPALLLLLIITQTVGDNPPEWLKSMPGGAQFWVIVFALSLAVIPGVTRVVRGAVLAEKNNQYIEAARASGAWAPRILFRHIMPNVIALAIIIMTTLLGGIILAEAALSFLGLGIPDAVSWGKDVSDSRNAYPYHVPSAIFPGGAITLTVLGFNLLGDAIRDIADPRLRGSR